MATITSADDGTVLEFEPGGDFLLQIAGGSTIEADVVYKSSEGNWKQVQDADGLADIAAAYDQVIRAAPGRKYGVSVVTATGTWDWSWSRVNKS